MSLFPESPLDLRAPQAVRRRWHCIFPPLLLAVALAMSWLWVVRPARAGSQATRYVAPAAACQGATPCYASLQAAVDASSPGDLILVAQGVYTLPQAAYEPGAQVVRIDRSLSVRGGFAPPDWSNADPQAHPTTLNALSLGRALVISAPVSVTLEGLIFTGGFDSLQGGGVYISGAQVRLRRCTLQGNLSAGQGGGLYARQAHLTLEASRLANNLAQGGGGGAAYLEDGHLVEQASAFEGNQAAADGGGLYLVDVHAVLTGSLFSANQALGSLNGGGGLFFQYGFTHLQALTLLGNHAGYGGGLSAKGSQVELLDSAILSNTADYNGGGVYFDHTAGALAGNQFRFNQAYNPVTNGGGGGGFYAQGGYLALLGNQFALNGASQNGGGAYLFSTDSTLRNNTFQENQALASGGGLFAQGPPPAVLQGRLVLQGNQFIKNNAHSGGGAHLERIANLQVERNTFNLHTFQNYGGGLLVRNSPLILRDNDLNGNFSASGIGGGLYLDAVDGRLEHNTLQDNQAGAFGGGMYVRDSLLRSESAFLAGNSSAYGGGAYFWRTTAFLTNTLLANNQALTQGSGLLLDSATAHLWHATLASNSGAEGSGLLATVYLGGAAAGQAWLTNTIVTSHTLGLAAAQGAAVTADHTLWFGNASLTSPGVVTRQDRSGDPHFLSPPAWDYHIGVASAALDQG